MNNSKVFDNFPIYFLVSICLVLVIVIGGIALFYKIFPPTETGIVAEYEDFEFGPDRIRVGINWYWLPEDVYSDRSLLGRTVRVELNFGKTVIEKLIVLE